MKAIAVYVLTEGKEKEAGLFQRLNEDGLFLH
jgi:hypothetical protein